MSESRQLDLGALGAASNGSGSSATSLLPDRQLHAHTAALVGTRPADAALRGGGADSGPDLPRLLLLRVYGTPIPKGSYRAMTIGGKARLIASTNNKAIKKLKAWKTAVQLAVPAFTKTFEDQPLELDATFWLERPAGHFRANGTLKPSAPRYPRWRPDGDKLLRSTLDALNEVAFDDDARVVDQHARKRYVTPEEPAGATILIRVMA